MAKDYPYCDEVGYCAGCNGEIYPGDPVLEIAIPGFKVVHYDKDRGEDKDECLKLAVNASKKVAVDRRRLELLRRY